MTPLSRIEGIAAPLPLRNVDTDKILPARFLKTIHRAGLGRALFASLREQEGCVLDQAPWNEARILIALDNFGCGSSREHAPWALLDFGIRCVIAPSFADIFYNNCFKNSILPISLPAAQVAELLALAAVAASAWMVVDLPSQQITASAGACYDFSIDAARKAALLQGLDEIGETLSLADAIDRFEKDRPGWILDIPTKIPAAGGDNVGPGGK